MKLNLDVMFNKEMVRILVLLLFICALCACSEPGTESMMPTPLMDGFKSLSTVDEISHLNNTEHLEVIENSGLPEGDARPPFNIYTVSIPYQHLEVDGKLVFYFYNNRLMSTWFYPRKKAAYLNKLKNKGIDLTEETELDANRYTQVWKYIDFQKSFYVGWEDIRLRDEQHAWIEKYS